MMMDQIEVEILRVDFIKLPRIEARRNGRLANPRLWTIGGHFRHIVIWGGVMMTGRCEE
jgi:hypothetical protein